jgi:hypothetical protein
VGGGGGGTEVEVGGGGGTAMEVGGGGTEVGVGGGGGGGTEVEVGGGGGGGGGTEVVVEIAMKCPVALSSDLEQTVEKRPTRTNTIAIDTLCIAGNAAKITWKTIRCSAQEYQEILLQVMSLESHTRGHGPLPSQPSSTRQQQSPEGNMEVPTEMYCVKLENGLVPTKAEGTYLIQSTICRLNRLPADGSRSPSATEVVLLGTTR